MSYNDPTADIRINNWFVDLGDRSSTYLYDPSLLPDYETERARGGSADAFEVIGDGRKADFWDGIADGGLQWTLAGDPGSAAGDLVLLVTRALLGEGGTVESYDAAGETLVVRSFNDRDGKANADDLFTFVGAFAADAYGRALPDAIAEAKADAAPIAPQIGGTWFAAFKAGIGWNLLYRTSVEELEDTLQAAVAANNGDVNASLSGINIGKLTGDFQIGGTAKPEGAFGPDLLIGGGHSIAEGTTSKQKSNVITGSNHDGDGLGDVIYGDFWENDLREATEGKGVNKPWQFNDTIDGDGGDDLIFGQDGNDRLFGDGGDDQLFGGFDKDHLDGGTGDDTLVGGAGDDTLTATGQNAGWDVMEGGEGDDTFFFEKSGLDTHHRITDFTPGADVIRLNSSRIDGLEDMTIVQVGLDTVIDYTHHMETGSLTLLNTLAGDLDADDFLFG